MGDLLQQLGPDLEALARARATPVVRCERVSRHGATRETRDTFRLDFADGTALKGRRVASPAAAGRIEAIVTRLDPSRFARVVARRGAALLEEWIAGDTLDTRPVLPEHVRWAGETLGAVHRLAPPLGRPPFWLRARRILFARHLRRLAAAGAIADADARRLRDLALANAPQQADFALVHRDLCPENIVVGPDGRLVCVDNATARGGSPEEDLARVCYRWPLDEADRERFLDAYGARRDPGAFLRHRRFWMVVALAHASWIRHSRGYARADVPLRRLLKELRGDADARKPCCTSPTPRS